MGLGPTLTIAFLLVIIIFMVIFIHSEENEKWKAYAKENKKFSIGEEIYFIVDNKVKKSRINGTSTPEIKYSIRSSSKNKWVAESQLFKTEQETLEYLFLNYFRYTAKTP